MPRQARYRTGVPIDGALAVVTGAGAGIGRATALALAAGGARVVVVDVDGSAAASAATECGGWAAAVDVSDPIAVARLADEVLAAHGVPDIVVNNAGVGLSARFLDSALEDWSWIIDTNLLGAVNVCRAFGPAMVDRHSGHVVNVSSGLAFVPRPSESAYVTTKAALLAFSRCLRADWHGEGIGVSAVCPGVIATDLVARRTRFRGAAADEARRRAVRLWARGHRPELVAGAVIDAIVGDRSVVPVGFESRLAWWAQGVVPTAVVDRCARSRRPRL
jgi:NAD(P)-dependent dehydrogenase (short-subunit alcohol dehydrogenase family)